MDSENYKAEENPLKKLEEVIKKIEDPTDKYGLHKFIDTAIYHCFVHWYNIELSSQST